MSGSLLEGGNAQKLVHVYGPLMKVKAGTWRGSVKQRILGCDVVLSAPRLRREQHCVWWKF